MGICLIDIQGASRCHAAGTARVDREWKRRSRYWGCVLATVAGWGWTRSRRSGGSGRGVVWGPGGDGVGVFLGRKLERRSLLVETLLTDPSRRASLTNRLCGVAFLTQPRSLSQISQLSINIGHEPFFFGCCKGDDA